MEQAVGAFRKSGRLPLDDARWQRAAGMFAAHSIDDDTHERGYLRDVPSNGMLIDPHTAIGVDAARATVRDPAVPMVSLATAHPAKFPDAVEEATGVRPALPAHLADLFDREERMVSLPNDLGPLSEFVRENIALEGAA